MKTHVRTLLAVLATAGTWPLAAQVTGSSPTAPDEEVLELSPFEVRADSDVGYQATETLAGTRIRTDLRDVGSAISVATKEFMRDIGATDNQTLLQYMPGTEVGGLGGNFAGLGDSSILSDAATRLNPNTNTRVRGLDSADNTRDFFLTDIPWDSYNTSRVDIQRGANSILFGNGSGAGIINGAPDGATFGVNSTVVEARYGSYGSYRGSINMNRELIPGQLAVRIAGLFDKRFYRQEPSYNQDQRYYGALRYEPEFLKRGSARTSIRVSYENGKVRANRPRTSTPMDQISPWFRTAAEEMHSPTPVNDAGATLLGTINPMRSHAGYDPFVTGINNAGVIAANPGRQDIGAGVNGTANTEPWITFGSGNGINGDLQGGFIGIYEDPNSSRMSHFMAPSTLGTYFAVNSAGLRDGTVTGLRAPIFNGILHFGDYAATRGFLYQGSGVYRATGISDPTIFDFYNKLLDGPNKREYSNFDAFNVSFEQTFLNDRLGFQFAADTQSYTVGQSGILGGSPIIGLDIWTHLPAATVDATGMLQPIANPNFGRPFTASGRGSYSRQKTDRTTLRVTPFADVNFKDIMKSDNLFTKVLGRHQITGLLEKNEVVSKGQGGPFITLPYNVSSTLMGPGGGIGDVTRKVSVLSYLGPSLASGSLSGANLSAINALQQPTSGQAIFFNSNYLPSAPSPGAPYTPPALGTSPSSGGSGATQSENPANYVGWSARPSITMNNAEVNGTIATNANASSNLTESWALVDQWALLDRHIVLTAGVRKDTIETFLPNGTGTRPISTANYNTIDFAAPFPWPTMPTRTFESDTLKTYSIVLHSPDFINRHLPWGLRASVFYGKSDNFRPSTRIDVYGDELAPPSGSTKDYGVSFTALDGRVAVKWTHYETTVTSAGLTDDGNGLRSRIGDELEQTLRYALATKNHVQSQGYRQNNPFDPTGLYAWTPTKYADGTLITTATLATRPITQADWVATEAYAQQVADAALAATVGETEILNAYGIDLSKYDPATGAGLSRATPQGLTITMDTLSKGDDFEIFLRPTDNWNITMNASKTFATRTNIAASTVDWMERRWDLYTSNSLIGELPWFGAGQANTDQAGRTNTAGLPRFGRNAWAFYNLFRAQEGNAVPELRPWRYNVVTNYNFSRGTLKGLFVGGGFRWEDENIIGYGVTEVTPAISASNPAIGRLDPAKPFYGPTEDHLDLWIGYNRKIFRDVDWRVSLNLRNAFESAHLVPINTNPDGSVASWRIADGQTWSVTSTFRF